MGETASGQILTREELYQRVWTTPVRRLAKEFGLSDVGLAKVCKRLKIPSPPVGYWEKLKHGKRVEQPPLLPIDDAHLGQVLFRRAPKGDVENEASPMEGFFDSEISRLAEEEASGKLPVVVPVTLRSAHPLVARTKRKLMGAPSPQLDGPCFAVELGKSLAGRALRLIEAFVRACLKRGYEFVELKESWQSTLLLQALGVQCDIRICEPVARKLRELTPGERERRRRDPDLPKYDYVPSGQLRLQLFKFDGQKTLWSVRDKGRSLVEDRLSEFMMAILRAADEHRRILARMEEAARHEAEIERRRREEEERRRLEEQRRKEEAERVQDLLAEVGDWEKGRRLRSYLDAVRSAAIHRYGFIEAGSEADQWLTWTESVANQLDQITPIQLEEVASAGDSCDASSTKPR